MDRAAGAGPWAICDRCGRQRRHASLRADGWKTALLVCDECWDPNAPHMHAPRIDPNEGAPIRNPRPEQEAVFLGDNEVTADDL